MLGLIGSLLPPHEAIHDAGIALNNPRDLHRHILGGIVGDRCAEVAVLLHLHCQINGLQQLLRVDAGEDEAALVQRLRPLGGGADAHCRKRLAYRQVEARLLRQGAAVRHDAEGVHLQAVVIVKAQRLVGDDAPVQLESAFLQSLTAPGVAGVQHRQVVLRRHGVYCREQGSEILLRVDVFLPVGREQNVLAFFQTEPGVNVTGLDLGQILMQHLRHGAAHHKRALLRDACGVQIPPCVLGVAQVHIGGHVHNAAVGLLRQALVEAAVPGLHVENRNVQPLGGDNGQAGVGIAQHQHGVRLDLLHQRIALGNDRADGLAEIRPGGVQIVVRRPEAQVLKEHLVQLVVVVLPGVDENLMEIPVAAFYGGGKADDLRPRAENCHQLELFHFRPPQRTCPGAAGRSTRWPT